MYSNAYFRKGTLSKFILNDDFVILNSFDFLAFARLRPSLRLYYQTLVDLLISDINNLIALDGPSIPHSFHLISPFDLGKVVRIASCLNALSWLLLIHIRLLICNLFNLDWQGLVFVSGGRLYLLKLLNLGSRQRHLFKSCLLVSRPTLIALLLIV